MILFSISTSQRRKRAAHASRDGTPVGGRVHVDANDRHGFNVALFARPFGRFDQRHARRSQQTAAGTTGRRHSVVLSGAELTHQVVCVHRPVCSYDLTDKNCVKKTIRVRP